MCICKEAIFDLEKIIEWYLTVWYTISIMMRCCMRVKYSVFYQTRLVPRISRKVYDLKYSRNVKTQASESLTMWWYLFP